jgi:hypothetical protein
MLTPPKLVTQTGLTCWAASLESWLSVKQHSPVAWHTGGEKSIVEDIKTWNVLYQGLGKGVLVDQAGSLTKAGAIWVLENAGMAGKGFPNPKLLTGQFIYSKLKEKGHLYVIRTWPDWSHAEVIYGIENWESSKTCKVAVMDPRPSYGYFKFDLDSFQTDKSVLIAWLAP